LNLFITGTDTGVGKTYVTSLIVRGLRKAGLDTVAMKPICCGDREDAELLLAAAQNSLELNDVNPVWLRTPAAPYAGAMIENRNIDLDLIRDKFARLRRSHRSLLVEGVGGWLVPIRRDYLVSDLATDFGLPVAVVVRNRLGALNHALLTVRHIQSCGLQCAGIIWNDADAAGDVSATTNKSVLEDLLEVPVLFDIAKDQRDLILGIA
jgi:dethiobiotin synthetase